MADRRLVDDLDEATVRLRWDLVPADPPAPPGLELWIPTPGTVLVVQLPAAGPTIARWSVSELGNRAGVFASWPVEPAVTADVLDRLAAFRGQASVPLHRLRPVLAPGLALAGALLVPLLSS